MKKKIAIIFLFNLLLSFLYFKQLFFPGEEIMYLDLNGMMLTPFALFYNLLGIIILLLLFNRGTGKSIKSSISEKISWFIFIIMLIGFVIFPLTFLTLTDGRKVASPLLFAFIEPLKGKLLFNQDLKQIFVKNIFLFIISFALFFIADLLPPFHAVNQNSWPIYFSGFYFLCLAFLDFWFQHKSFPKTV